MKKLLCSLLVLVFVSMSVVAQDDPDRDGDGVPDSRDRCVSEPGPESNNGCPESDNPDREDDDRDDESGASPTANADEGPPDTDGDGTADPQDNCPLQPGDGVNFGCPNGIDGANASPSEDNGQSEPTTPDVILTPAPETLDCLLSTAGGSAVNMRTFASTDSDIVAQIEPNQWVQVLMVVNTENSASTYYGLRLQQELGLLPPGVNADTSYVSWAKVVATNGVQGWVALDVARIGGNCSDFDSDDDNIILQIGSPVFEDDNGDLISDFTVGEDFIQVVESDLPGVGVVPGLLINNFVWIPDQRTTTGMSGSSFDEVVLFVRKDSGDNLSEFDYGIYAPGCVFIGTFQLECSEESDTIPLASLPDGCTLENVVLGRFQVSCEDGETGSQGCATFGPPNPDCERPPTCGTFAPESDECPPPSDPGCSTYGPEDFECPSPNSGCATFGPPNAECDRPTPCATFGPPNPDCDSTGGHTFGEDCELVVNDDGKYDTFCEAITTQTAMLFCMHNGEDALDSNEECYSISIPPECSVALDDAGMWQILCTPVEETLSLTLVPVDSPMTNDDPAPPANTYMTITFTTVPIQPYYHVEQVTLKRGYID